MKKTIKEGTKRIIPEVNLANIETRRNMAAQMKYVPDSIRTLQKIHPSDVRIMMLNNKDFYDTTVALCDKAIKRFIKRAKTMDGSREVQEAVTLDDLLRSGLYWEDYEESRKSFVTVFVGEH